jgi:hypothetical protein
MLSAFHRLLAEGSKEDPAQRYWLHMNEMRVFNVRGSQASPCLPVAVRGACVDTARLILTQSYPQQPVSSGESLSQ